MIDSFTTELGPPPPIANDNAATFRGSLIRDEGDPIEALIVDSEPVTEANEAVSPPPGFMLGPISVTPVLGAKATNFEVERERPLERTETMLPKIPAPAITDVAANPTVGGASRRAARALASFLGR